MPGEFRRSQNWIGGTRSGNAAFVPPPHEEVAECMGNLENFIHDMRQRTPTLIKAALTHVQFEMIHPFLDGNGRVGRLLIPLLLCEELNISRPTAVASLLEMQRLGIVRETSGRARNRLFVYDEYLKLLNEGTEPL